MISYVRIRFHSPLPGLTLDPFFLDPSRVPYPDPESFHLLDRASYLFRSMAAAPPSPVAVGEKPARGNAISVGFENVVEQLEPVACDLVEGQIPAFLFSSQLYRVGPGLFSIPDRADPSKAYEIKHWFDGIGMVHQFHVTSEGQVLYRNRITSQGTVKYVQEKKSAGALPSFGQPIDPCVGVFGKAMSAFRLVTSKVGNENSNVGVTLSRIAAPAYGNTQGHAKHEAHAAAASKDGEKPHETLYALKTDANVLHFVNPETLAYESAGGYEDWDSHLKDMATSAHEGTSAFVLTRAPVLSFF